MGRRKNRSSTRSMVPPALPQNPVIKRTLRYVGSAGTCIVYRNCLLSLMAAKATTGQTVGIYVINAIRIKRIRLWSLADSGTQQISLVWGTSQGPTDAITAIGNVTFPAHVDVRPPAGSYAGMWQMHDPAAAIGTEGDLIFEIVNNSSTIADIDFEYVLEGNVASNARLSDPATGVFDAAFLGVGYTHLDCLNSAGAAAGLRFFAPNFFDPILVSGRTP